MFDFLLNDILTGVLLLTLLWSVALSWLALAAWRYICRLHEKIDALREGNETLHAELAHCYSSRNEEWMDELVHDLFGEEMPRP